MLFEIVAGLMLGYLVTTVLESTFHRVIYHASPQTRRLWVRYPWIGGPFRRAYFSHGIIHHRWTFRRDFVTQFCSDDEKERLDQRIGDDQDSLIRREGYGVTIRGVGLVWFNLPILWVVPLIGFGCGPWVLLGALPAFTMYSLLPTFVHPYLHKPHDEAVQDAAPWLRWVFKTSYVKFLRRYHYLHHQYTDCNFNLLIGGDFLLGRYQAPIAQDWDEMCRLGLVVDDPRKHAPSMGSPVPRISQ